MKKIKYLLAVPAILLASQSNAFAATSTVLRSFQFVGLKFSVDSSSSMIRACQIARAVTSKRCRWHHSKLRLRPPSNRQALVHIYPPNYA